MSPATQEDRTVQETNTSAAGQRGLRAARRGELASSNPYFTCADPSTLSHAEHAAWVANCHAWWKSWDGARRKLFAGVRGF